MMPRTLDEFISEKLPLFDSPPDSDWYFGLAQIYQTTPARVEQTFRAQWNAVHVAVPPVVPATASSAARDTQHPFDRVLSALRA